MSGKQQPLSDEDYKSILTPIQYEVTRNKATERAFTGEYWNVTDSGVYKCICCGHPVFDAETKYESGSGWPSFFAPIGDDSVATEEDFSHGMHRVEVMCARCGSHLGHVFEDGPAPTGLRYCMNSVSLDLDKKDG